MGLYSGSLYESYYFEVTGPGFLNQVPTLESRRRILVGLRVWAVRDQKLGAGTVDDLNEPRLWELWYIPCNG